MKKCSFFILQAHKWINFVPLCFRYMNEECSFFILQAHKWRNVVSSYFRHMNKECSFFIRQAHEWRNVGHFSRQFSSTEVNISGMRFKVLTLVKIKIIACWVMTHISLSELKALNSADDVLIWNESCKFKELGYSWCLSRVFESKITEMLRKWRSF
jgi:hypothetical protein